MKKSRRKPTPAQRLNRELRRREAKQLKRPARTAMPAPEGVAMLVIVDRAVAKPYLVKWREGPMALWQEHACATAADANTYLTLLKHFKAELWVKVKQ